MRYGLLQFWYDSVLDIWGVPLSPSMFYKTRQGDHISSAVDTVVQICACEVWTVRLMCCDCRWHVDRGAKWNGRVCCWDVVWTDSCAIHFDEQGVGCNGMPYNWGSSMLICFPHSSMDIGWIMVHHNRIPHTRASHFVMLWWCAAGKMQKCWLWQVPTSLLLRSTLSANGPVRYPTDKYCKDLLPEVWRHLLSQVKVPGQYPLPLLCIWGVYWTE
jgi:hypothetical protein